MTNPEFVNKIHAPREPIELDVLERMFAERVRIFENVVVFSPHFDDAILSTGSLLLNLSSHDKPVRVFNFFTESGTVVSPYTQRLSTMGGAAQDFKQYFAMREKEDADAFKKLGNVTVTNLGFTDAAWRTTESGEPFYPVSALIGVNTGDQTENAVKKAMEDLTLDPDSTVVFAPVGRGTHADHLVVRNAANKLFPNIVFYADVPYTEQNLKDDNFVEKEELVSFPWRGDQKGKKELVLMYETQLISLLRNGDLHFQADVYYIFSDPKRRFIDPSVAS